MNNNKSKERKKYTFQMGCLPVVARVTFPLLPDSRLEHLSNILSLSLSDSNPLKFVFLIERSSICVQWERNVNTNGPNKVE